MSFKLVEFNVGDLVFRKFPQPGGKTSWQTGMITESEKLTVLVKWLPNNKVLIKDEPPLRILKSSLRSMIIGGTMKHSGQFEDPK